MTCRLDGVRMVELFQEYLPPKIGLNSSGGGLSSCPNTSIAPFMNLTSQRIEEVWLISATPIAFPPINKVEGNAAVPCGKMVISFNTVERYCKMDPI